MRAAAEAIAQLRADLGEAAVCKAVLCEGHLPEAQFTWEPFEKLTRARPRDTKTRAIARRIHARPLPARPEGREFGRYLVSGGWWHVEITREYVFIEDAKGACRWLYFDHRRRRWFLHGRLE